VLGTPEIDDLFELEVTSEMDFNYDETVEESKFILKKLFDENILQSGRFEDDIWIFSKSNEYLLRMNFSDISKEYKDLVKCWCAVSLERMYPENMDKYLSIFRVAASVTEQFHISKIETLREYISKLSETSKKAYIYAIINFLNYTRIENSEDYIVSLNSISVDKIDGIRKLPNFYDVMTFHDIINHFMNHWTEKEKHMFFPIVIWWKLTTIIPMRIREFCNMSRSCLLQHERGISIIVPRVKNSFLERHNDKNQKLEISDSIAKLIVSYIEISSPYGHSDTLISFRMYKDAFKKGNFDLQANPNKFKVANFKNLLEQFYQMIVHEKYGLRDIEQIKPNDTRHFAFCSLMLQGIDPLTIARLGGHTKLESQLHYQRHLDYFVQSKIYQLTRLNMLTIKDNNYIYNSPLLLEKYEVKSLLSIDNYKDVMETDEGGFCTDALEMKCESTRSCLMCSKYWISRELLSSKLEELIIMDKEVLQSIQMRIKTIERYWNEAYSLVEDGDFNLLANESLQHEIKKINGYINDSSNLKTLILLAKGE